MILIFLRFFFSFEVVRQVGTPIVKMKRKNKWTELQRLYKVLIPSCMEYCFYIRGMGGGYWIDMLTWWSRVQSYPAHHSALNSWSTSLRLAIGYLSLFYRQHLGHLPWEVAPCLPLLLARTHNTRQAPPHMTNVSLSFPKPLFFRTLYLLMVFLTAKTCPF